MYSSFYRLSGLGQDAAPWGENRVLVFPTQLDEQILANGLAKVLKKFPILSGRIIKEPTSGSYVAVECNEGVDITYSVIQDASLSNSLKASKGEAVMSDVRFHSFFPSPFPGLGWDKPLMIVRVTVLIPVSYTILAFTIPHGAFDGFSTFTMMRHWDFECNALADSITLNSTPLPQPYFRVPRPELLTDAELRRRFPQEFIDRKVAIGAVDRVQELVAELRETHRYMRLSVKGPQLCELKQRVMAALDKEHIWISTAELLFAIITFGSMVSRFGWMNSQKTIKLPFRAVVDMRKRSHFFPDDGFIGCAYSKPVTEVDAPLPRTQDVFSMLLEYCRFIHRELRNLIADRKANDDQYCLIEYQYRRPDLRDSLFNHRYLTLLEQMGLEFNSWKTFEANLQTTMGSNTSAIYMNNTPLYGDICIPRMNLIIPTRPDGTVDLRVHLSVKENDQIKHLCEELGLL